MRSLVGIRICDSSAESGTCFLVQVFRTSLSSLFVRLSNFIAFVSVRISDSRIELSTVIIFRRSLFACFSSVATVSEKSVAFSSILFCEDIWFFV